MADHESCLGVRYGRKIDLIFKLNLLHCVLFLRLSRPSSQTFLNCGPLRNFSNGCNGGDVPDVLAYMAKWGLPDETCL
jgi:hypothetical protein